MSDQQKAQGSREGKVNRRNFLQGAGVGVAVGAVGGVVGTASVNSGITARAKSSMADLVLYNGNVITMDGRARKEAVAIKDGFITAVGNSADIRKLIGTSTEVINLRGKTALPGINDAHFHPTSFGLGQPPLTLDVSKRNVSSISDIADVVRKATESKDTDEWIRGRGWDQGYLKEERFPRKGDLDKASPNNPVILTDWTGHAVWVNSRAMEIAGVTHETPSPSGGEIVKDDNGEPTGLFRDAASSLIQKKVPDFSSAERRKALLIATKTMHTEGITSVTDAGMGPDMIDLYQELQESGDLRQRVNLMISRTSIDKLEETLTEVKKRKTDTKWLAASQMKIWGDGVPTQARTAWVSEDYKGGGAGGLTLPGDTEEEQLELLEESILLAHRMGFQIGVHATGDRTIDAVVDSYIKAQEKFGDNNLRHYVIHGDLTPLKTLDKMAAHGISVSFNPNIKRSLSHQLTDVIGRERTDYQWPYRSALSRGVHVGSSSDAPVVYPTFREGLTAMMTRKSAVDGEVYGKDQCLDLDEALATYTTGPAHQDNAETWKGQLTRGFVGDITVIDGDLDSTDAADIIDLPIDMTVVGGDIVYDSQSHATASAAMSPTSTSTLAVTGEYMLRGCCHEEASSV